MRVEWLATVIVAMPAVAAVLIVGLCAARTLIDGARAGSARLEKALRWLPPRGRLSRAVGWAGLFVTLMLLLALPSLLETWPNLGGSLPGTTDAEGTPLLVSDGNAASKAQSGPGEPGIRTLQSAGGRAALAVGSVGADGFGFPPERWLVAIAVGVVAICGAVSAWVDRSGEMLWAALLVLLSAALAILGARSLVVALAAGEVAALVLGVMLSLAGRPGMAGGETEIDRGSGMRVLRQYLTMSLLASGLVWSGWAMELEHRWMRWLLLAGLLVRCGGVPGHVAYISAAARLPLAGSMMLLGAVVPAGVMLAGTVADGGSSAAGIAGAGGTPGSASPGGLGDWGGVLAVPMLLGAAWSWAAAPSERDLARTAARWSIAAGNIALAVALAGLFRATALLTVIAAVGSAAALYLVGSVERVAGHREIGRLRGLGARLPGIYGWMVVVVLAIAGGPPFASFAGRLLTGSSNPGMALELGVLSVLAIAAGLSSVHRTFLGIPRRDEGEPVLLQGRERLVLTLLFACAVGASLAPTSLWRQARIPPLLPPPPTASPAGTPRTPTSRDLPASSPATPLPTTQPS